LTQQGASSNLRLANHDLNGQLADSVVIDQDQLHAN